ncbi:MAG: YqeG family HAD IIIA-type phosphatase [Clostridiales bacterium]|nr:YqeG family HAD IIIA-type phosphatase [Clostridiales bacterium]
MAVPQIPDYIVSSVYALTPQWLAERGKTLVLADLDNTLARYGEPGPSEKLKQWRDELAAAGIQVFLLSNGRKPRRSREFAGAFRIDYIGHAGKPRRRSFDAALERTGVHREAAVMVGDQIFTDVWGAHNAGITAVLVRPIALDTAFRRLRYWVETPFRRACPHPEGLE